MHSDLTYDGPAAYVNIIRAGSSDDDPAFFRLYISQALVFQNRVTQHHDPQYRRRFPSLQYDVLSHNGRTLRTICSGKFPKSLEDQPERQCLLLNLLEKLGTLLFQTLPFQTLAYFLPCGVQIGYPNVNLNVLSPLYQNRDGNVPREYIDEALCYLKDSDNPFIQAYYLKRACHNPFVTALLERTLEKKGGEPRTYGNLPEGLKGYLERRGLNDEESVQNLVTPGLTLIQTILYMMSDNGRVTQASAGYPA